MITSAAHGSADPPYQPE